MNLSGNLAIYSGVKSTNRKQLRADTAAAILLEFREGRATDLKSLMRAFGFDWPPRTAPAAVRASSLDVVWRVEELVGIGLLQADGSDLYTSKIRVTDLLSRLQKALDQPQLPRIVQSLPKHDRRALVWDTRRAHRET